MQFFPSQFSTHGEIDIEWGRKQQRSSGRTPSVRKLRNLSELMKVMKKEMKMSSATSKVKDVVGWRNPPKDWEPWVRKLCSVHQSTWKNAGIYEAVMSSIYSTKRQDDLILELASKWCSQTNTFVFPWGEATLTLEDTSVLGGFSAFGISAFSSLENDAGSLNIKEQLELARLEIQGSHYKARQTKWIKKFVGSGNDFENAALLSVWLSRFVFPAGSSSSFIVNKRVFPIAARLSRGIRIALGPVVLATLYKELTALTKRPVDNVGPTHLFAPFHLVQIWAWERFPKLKPDPNRMYLAENFPRIARWSIVQISKHRDLKSSTEDSSGKAFLWRPYDNAFAETDPKSFALCIKTSELVGFDSCIETYQPQRVTRQFGLDQDISFDNVDKKTNVKLFAARSPSFQPTITAFYEKWRKQQSFSQAKVKNEVDCGPPPGFGPRIEVTNVGDDKSGDGQLVQPQDSNLVPSHSSNEAMEVVNGFVHETREEEEESEVELATSCDAESYTNERSMDSGLNLEERISRLENIVYGHIKALEATM